MSGRATGLQTLDSEVCMTSISDGIWIRFQCEFGCVHTQQNDNDRVLSLIIKLTSGDGAAMLSPWDLVMAIDCSVN